MRARLLLIGLALVGLGACDGCGGKNVGPPGPAAEQADKAPAPLPKAVVEGVVRLASGHELPQYGQAQMEAKVLDHTTRGAWPKECTPPKQVDSKPVRASAEGGLSGVVLAASQFKTGRSRPPKTHEVAIEDCRLTPRVVVAVKGDTLRLKNNVDYPFMPSFGQSAMARSLTTGQTQDFKLDDPGVFPLRCGFTAPCGRTDVIVMLHPLHTVTDEDGKFRLEELPADEPFVLSAWHPLFQEARVDLHVSPGETEKIEFVLTLAAAAAGQGPDAAAATEGSDEPQAAAKPQAATDKPEAAADKPEAAADRATPPAATQP